MQAVVLTRFGPPEALQLQEVATPTPKENEVLIQVRATSVFAGDAELRSLRFPLELRVPLWLYLRFVRPKPLILGQDLAGDIVAVGARVRRFKPGDAVYAVTSFGLGGYAQFKTMPEEPGEMDGALAYKPANLTYAEAAAVPVSGLEALHFIRQGRLRSGESILVIGAGGSIGTMAVQLAKGLGAKVTAVDSTPKLDLLRSLGADAVIDYTREPVARPEVSFDVILDVAGTSHFGRSVQMLKPQGRYLLANPSLGHRLRAGWRLPAGKRAIHGTGAHRAGDLLYLKERIEAGELKPVIDRRYTLEQMAEAHRYVDTGQKKGNVVVTVEHP